MLRILWTAILIACGLMACAMGALWIDSYYHARGVNWVAADGDSDHQDARSLWVAHGAIGYDTGMFVNLAPDELSPNYWQHGNPSDPRYPLEVFGGPGGLRSWQWAGIATSSMPLADDRRQVYFVIPLWMPLSLAMAIPVAAVTLSLVRWWRNRRQQHGFPVLPPTAPM